MKNTPTTDLGSNAPQTSQVAIPVPHIKDIYTDESSVAEFVRAASERHLRLNNYLTTLTIQSHEK